MRVNPLPFVVDLLRSLESSNDMGRSKLRTGTSSIPERLKELGYKNYNEYLRSEHWQEFRKRFFQTKSCQKLRAKYGELRCQFCFASGRLGLHHKTYRRLGQEHCGDVVLICNDCHEKVHAKAKNQGEGANLWKITNRLGRRIRRTRSLVRL